MTEIVQAGETVLRQPAGLVPREMFGTLELNRLIEEMVATMRAAPGVGLAAPQIGKPLQIIVIEDDSNRMSQLSEAARVERERTAVPLTVIINPELTPLGPKCATFFEGCLSVTGWMALVPRYLEVEVKGFTPAGEASVWNGRGWPARILQHEVDHLRGTLYIDRMHSRSFARAEVAQRVWGARPLAEVAAELGINLQAPG